MENMQTIQEKYKGHGLLGKWKAYRAYKKLTHSGMVQSRGGWGLFFTILLYLGLAFCAFIALIPMWHTLMLSISDPFALQAFSGLAVLPVGGVTFEGYSILFESELFWLGWRNTIMYVAGTVLLGFVLNVMGGYALSRQTLLKKPMMIFLMITLVFGGGMLPTYMVMNELGLVGTPFAIILPEATMAMYLVLAMNAFLTVPESTVEAAELDGAGHFTIMFRVMFPQCGSLFFVTVINTFVASYNSWMSAKIYLPVQQDLWPLQLVINEIIAENADYNIGSNPNYARYLVQFCTTVAAVLPLMVAFPFFQKKMEAGMMLGGVKG